MSKNKLCDLNDHLFMAIERLEDDDICVDEKTTLNEIQKAKAISDLGKMVIDNNRLQLDILKLQEEFAIKDKEMPTNLLLGVKDAE